MSLFDSSDRYLESLFRDEITLDHDYIPHKIPFRENENQRIAEIIKPLLNKRNSNNLFIFGPPGVGKTVAVRHVFREMEQKGLDEKVYPLYINCWQKDTSHKIILEICNQLRYRYTINKTTDQLVQDISKIINEKAAVIVLDEADKLDKESLSIVYTLLEVLYKKAIMVITNNKYFLSTLDQRILSRLLPESLEFRPYTEEEIFMILKERKNNAFIPQSFSDMLIKKIAQKTHERQDLRVGLFLLREAGNNAERKLKRKVEEEDIENAITKLPEYQNKTESEFTEDQNKLINIIKENSGKTTKEIHELYDHSISYRTFRRRLEDLEKTQIIAVKEENEGERKRSFVVYNSKI